jgi:hypothetical protein
MKANLALGASPAVSSPFLAADVAKRIDAGAKARGRPQPVLIALFCGNRIGDDITSFQRTGSDTPL